MASTLTPATLSVTIEESINLDGRQRGSTSTISIANIKNIYKRIVTCSNGTDSNFDGDTVDAAAGDFGADVRKLTTIANFANTVHDETSGGSLDMQKVQYLRVTNLDNTNQIYLALRVDNNDNPATDEEVVNIILEPGRSYIMGKVENSIDANTTAGNHSYANAGVARITSELAFKDLQSITVNPGAHIVDVEILVAST